MPDVVHFHYPNPLVALYILFCIPSKIKLIVHWHSDIVEQKILWRIISPIEQKILNRSTRIIVTSENYAKASMPLLKYISKITIIPCGIDEEKFVLTNRDLGEVSKIRDRYKNKPIIFFVGRHVEYKGIKYLLEAEKYIQSDCEIVIAGEGPLTESLKTKYRSNRINWIGRLSSEDLKLFYHSADIFSFPSITRNEAFGVVLAEAMYCRCVPVTFTIEGSGVNWVTLNGITGLEVPNRDVVSYAKALDLLIKNQELRSTLANNGYKRVNDLFTFSRVGISIRHLYESIIKY